MAIRQLISLLIGGLVIFIIVRFFWPTAQERAQKVPGGEEVPEEEAPLTGSKLTVAYSCTYPHEAHFVKGLLKEAGIPSSIFDEETVTANPFYSFVIGGVKVMVPVERLEEAKPVIEKYIQTSKETLRERDQEEEKDPSA